MAEVSTKIQFVVAYKASVHGTTRAGRIESFQPLCEDTSMYLPYRNDLRCFIDS